VVLPVELLIFSVALFDAVLGSGRGGPLPLHIRGRPRRQAGAGSAEVSYRMGWRAGTSGRNYRRFSLERPLNQNKYEPKMSPMIMLIARPSR